MGDPVRKSEFYRVLKEHGFHLEERADGSVVFTRDGDAAYVEVLNITGGDDEVKRGVVMRFAHKFRISVLEFWPSKHTGKSE